MIFENPQGFDLNNKGVVFVMDGLTGRQLDINDMNETFSYLDAGYSEDRSVQRFIDVILLYKNGHFKDVKSIFKQRFVELGVSEKDGLYSDVLIEDRRAIKDKIGELFKVWSEMNRIEKGIYDKVILKKPSYKVVKVLEQLIDRTEWFKKDGFMEYVGTSLGSDKSIFINSETTLIGVEITYRGHLNKVSDEELAYFNSYVTSMAYATEFELEGCLQKDSLLIRYNAVYDKIFVWKLESGTCII